MVKSNSYHIRSIDVGRGQYGALLLCQLGTRTLAGDTLPDDSRAAAAAATTSESAFRAAAAAKAATNSGATTQGAIPCLGKESFLERKKTGINSYRMIFILKLVEL